MKKSFGKFTLCIFFILVFTVNVTMGVFAVNNDHVLMYKDTSYQYVHSNFVSDYKAEGWEKAEIDKYGKITLYNDQDQTVRIYPEQLDEFLSEGWVFNRKYFGVITIYSKGGDSREISIFDVEKWEQKGWSTNKYDVIITMYSPDGRTKEVGINDIDENKKVGWFETQPVLLYNDSGESKYVEEYDVDYYRSCGWSTKKDDFLVTMYAADGRTKQVFESRVEEEKKVGWFTTVPVKMYSTDGKIVYVEEYDVDKYISNGWYTASFNKQKTYNNNFADISSNQWYFNEVVSAYELGFIDGISDTLFSPDTTVTIAQGITMAARVHATMNNKTIPQTSSGNWYDSYVEYAKFHGFVKDNQFSDYTAELKRYQMAELFYDMMPKGYYTVINNISRIPDVPNNEEYSFKIYALYNAGIFLGADDYGTFHPNDSITRKECAAIINRVAIPSNRIKGSLTEKTVTMYAADGRQKQVPESKVEAEKSVGWYTEPVVTMYAADGRTKVVPQSRVEAEKSVGWYTEPLVTMYAADGRTKVVPQSRVEAEKSVGWYTEPVIIMYAVDGRTKVVPQSRVEAEKSVGWYTEPYQANVHVELSAEQIYSKCAPCVFTIKVYDKNNKYFAQGSGFFINNSGVAITNYHVIEDSYSATVHLLNSDTVYNITGVYDYDKTNDWAVIQTNCTNNSFLSIGDKSTIVGGATVYALGTPKGFDGTISQGIISNPAREIDGYTYIQTDTAMTSGNSGGALINKYGEVIGINTMVYGDGSLGLNFAVPIHQALNYSSDILYPLESLIYGSAPSSSQSQQKPQTPQTPQTSSHEALVNYIIANGNYDADDNYYYIPYNHFFDDGDSLFVSLQYFVDEKRICLASLSDDNSAIFIYIPQKSNSYEISYIRETDTTTFIAKGTITPGYSLSDEGPKAITLTAFTANGKSQMYGSLHEPMENLIASTIALTVLVADYDILGNTTLSINSLYRLDV